MSKSRKFLTVGAVGVAAIALIGAGASATFHDAVNGSQTITAGTMNVQITDGAGGTVSANGKSVTLPATSPVGSTFQTTHKIITIKNNGNIAVDSAKISMSETHDGSIAANNALLAQTNVCIQSTDYSGGPWTEGNGPLTAAIALGVVQNDVHLLPGDSLTFSMDFYAGQNSTQCRPVHSDGSHTLAAWDAYLGGGYTTPASLTDVAQGGVITPTLTFSFTG
jgi:predicted ribosomally synthesized peptide with SipW-like signal peptide